MDKLDKKILACLQENGRISLTELSEKVGLSVSPCQRRLKSLEENDIIKGYRAEIDPASVGLNFSAMVFVKMKSNSGDNLREFGQAVSDIPQIVQAQMLMGEPDFILHIVAKNMDDFQKLHETKLTKLPHIASISSTLVMKTVISPRALPIE